MAMLLRWALKIVCGAGHRIRRDFGLRSEGPYLVLIYSFGMARGHVPSSMADHYACFCSGQETGFGRLPVTLFCQKLLCHSSTRNLIKSGLIIQKLVLPSDSSAKPPFSKLTSRGMKRCSTPIPIPESRALTIAFPFVCRCCFVLLAATQG